MGGAGAPSPTALVAAARRELAACLPRLAAEGVCVRPIDRTHGAVPSGTPDWQVPSDFCAANPRDPFLGIGHESLETPMADRGRSFAAWACRALCKDSCHASAPWTAAPQPQLLEALYDGRIIAVPKAVDTEMVQHVREWPTRKPSWITVTLVIAPYDSQAAGLQQSGLLEAGEAEAIALARQLSAAWFLTDDAAVRVFAAALGLEVHGSLGIILGAAARGHLSHEEAAATLDRLANSSLWISMRVLAEARAALDSLFP